MELGYGLHAVLWKDPGVNNCNAYLLDGPCRVLIDPGHSHLLGNLLEYMNGLSLSKADIDLVIATHGHPDHAEAIADFQGTETLIALHPADLEPAREPFGLPGTEGSVQPLEPHFFLEEGRFTAGANSFQVLHTPGHSPGSLSLYWEEAKALFCGDVIFWGGVGRTDLPGGSEEALKQSINRLSALDVHLLLPGHGDILSGREAVRRNFEEVERLWFAYGL